jgi:hypothetical protein
VVVEARTQSVYERAEGTKAVATPTLLLALGIALYLLIQLSLYPPTIGIKDESTYLSDAYVLRGGTIFADIARIPLWASIIHGGHVVPMYPPGQAALLLPAILIDWHLTFAVTVGLHVAGFLLFTQLLKRFRIRREWALLYLFFPALALFSRTLMTEIPSATLTLLALLLYFRGGRSRVAAGVVFGLLAFIAYKNLITFALLWLGAATYDAIQAWYWMRSRQPIPWSGLKSLRLSAGFLPLLALLIGYDLMVYGRPFGYGQSGFSVDFVLPNLAFYAVALSIAYPLMLLAPLLYRGPWRGELLFISVGSLLVMSAYYYIDNVHGPAENLLAGTRLLLPVIPVWILMYVSVLDRVIGQAKRPLQVGFATVAIGGAVLGSVAASAAHQQHLREADTIRALIYAHTSPQDQLGINDETAKFISPAWGTRSYALIRSGRTIVDPMAPTAPTAIIYTTQGAIDAHELPLAQRLAEQLGARQVLDRSVGAWRVVIWERLPAS